MEKPKGITSVFIILNWVPMLWIPQNHFKGESETTIVLSKASEFQTIFNNYQTPNKDSSETACTYVLSSLCLYETKAGPVMDSNEWTFQAWQVSSFRIEAERLWSYRRWVISPSTWADHASQNLYSINGDVPCGVDGFLSHRFAVNHHFSSGFADGHMKLGEIECET